MELLNYYNSNHILILIYLIIMHLLFRLNRGLLRMIIGGHKLLRRIDIGCKRDIHLPWIISTSPPHHLKTISLFDHDRYVLVN